MATAIPPGSVQEPVLAPEDLPQVDHLVTEDDTPADNFFVERQRRLLTNPLYSSWAAPNVGQGFLAAANLGLFFSTNQPPLVPDALLSLDVKMPADIWAKRGRSYFVWEYGKVPDVAVEIVSDTRGGEDSYKMRQYARGSVTYYVIWDPAHHLSEESLRVFVLREGTYVRLATPWLEAVGLGLTIWSGEYEGVNAEWLRWCDADGQVILTGKELAEQERERAGQAQRQAEQERERAQQERQRAEQESQRAEQELQRAEQERQAKEEASRRADLLAARLRALGIDPDA